MIGDLLDRKLDLVIARGRPTLADPGTMDRLSVDILFRDELAVVAGLHSRWGRRRKISLADLKDEPWILSAPGTWNFSVIVDAFRAAGLSLPRISVGTLSVHLRVNLLATGPYITVFPLSVLQTYGSRFSIKALPVDFPSRPWPVTIVTLKHRTLSPWSSASSTAPARSQNPSALPQNYARRSGGYGPLADLKAVRPSTSSSTNSATKM